MSVSLIGKVYDFKIGDSLSKSILAYLAYHPQFSLNELSSKCEISIEKVLDSLKYLIDHNFIKKKEGMILSKDPLDFIHQVEITLN